MEETLVGADEIGGPFDAFDELAVHVFGLDQVIAVDQLHVRVGKKFVGKIVLVLELLLIFHGIARDSEYDHASFLEFFESITKPAGFDGCSPGYQRGDKRRERRAYL